MPDPDGYEYSRTTESRQIAAATADTFFLGLAGHPVHGGELMQLSVRAVELGNVGIYPGHAQLRIEYVNPDDRIPIASGEFGERDFLRIDKPERFYGAARLRTAITNRDNVNALTFVIEYVTRWKQP